VTLLTRNEVETIKIEKNTKPPTLNIIFGKTCNPFLNITALRISGDPLKIYFHKVVRFSRLMDSAQRRPVSGWKSAEPMEQARSACSISVMNGLWPFI